MSQSATAFAAPTTNAQAPGPQALVDEPVEPVLDDRDLPARTDASTLSASTSAQTTSWPRWAKQAPVVRPT